MQRGGKHRLLSDRLVDRTQSQLDESDFLRRRMEEPELARPRRAESDGGGRAQSPGRQPRALEAESSERPGL